MPARAWLSKIRKRPGVYGDRLSCSDVLNSVGFAGLLRCPIDGSTWKLFGNVISASGTTLFRARKTFWAEKKKRRKRFKGRFASYDLLSCLSLLMIPRTSALTFEKLRGPCSLWLRWVHVRIRQNILTFQIFHEAASKHL
jgi:hypothetical protein